MKSIYEQIFQMKYYGGWSFLEAYNLPIGLRNWFFERLIQQKETEEDQLNNTSRSSS